MTYSSPADNHPALWRHDFPFAVMEDHKYTRGHGLIVGGDIAMSGAAILATKAAQRLCGMITIVSPQDAMMVYAIACPSAVLFPIVQSAEIVTIAYQRKCSAALIGCGAGVNETTKELTLQLLASSLPLVIDADALTVFADDAAMLWRAIQLRHAPTILTPHAGEFKRLFTITQDKRDDACLAAKQSGAVIVYKGAETVIATPQGQVVVNRHAPATLAVAGSGDTLAGMIVALVAQNVPAFIACQMATWLHGEAAHHAGLGLVAEDLASFLPDALTSLAMM